MTVSSYAETLKVYTYPREWEIARVERATELFQQKHPDVKVEYISGWLGKLDVAVAGGLAPDIVIADYSLMADFIGKRYFMPIDRFADSDPSFDLDSLIPATVEMMRWNGRLVGLPINMTVGGLLYNKDLFDKVALAYPTEEWTWNNYITDGKKLVRDTNGNGDVDQFAIHMPWGSHSYLPLWIYQSGARFWNEDMTRAEVSSPEFERAITFITDLVNQYRVAPRFEDETILEPELSGFDALDKQDLFVGEKIAMQYGATQLISNESYREMSLGLSRLPKGPAARVGLINGDMIGIYPQTEIAPLAWDYLKAMIRAVQELHVQGVEPFLPVDRETLREKLDAFPYPGIPDLAARIWQLALDSRPSRISHPATKVVRDFGWSLHQEMFNGEQKPVKPMLEDLEREANAEIKEALDKGADWNW